MSGAYWLVGDTRRTLTELAAAGVVVDLVVCSPPFLKLRSYLPDGDPAKALEIGSEASPGEFVDVLLDVVELVDLVLAPHGSLAFELGDTLAGSGGAGGDYAAGGLRDGQPAFAGSARAARTRTDGNGKRFAGGGRLPDATGSGWPADKSLSLIPELFRVALAYGRNPLTGRETPLWRIRNVVRWVRPNPPVGRDGDKFRPATSEVVIACRVDEAGRRRYWDGDAVRVPSEYNRANSAARTTAPGQKARGCADTVNPAGAPLLDWWKITSGGYDGAHYATYPPALVDPLVKAMSPRRVCTTCGEPARRISVSETSPLTGKPSVAQGRASERRGVAATGETHARVARRAETVGWTDCGHDTWRPGIVLDPFAGSGTTLAVATGHGRTAIGIDLDERNTALARDRIGPLLFHETTVADLAHHLGAARPIEATA